MWTPVDENRPRPQPKKTSDFEPGTSLSASASTSRAVSGVAARLAATRSKDGPSAGRKNDRGTSGRFSNRMECWSARRAADRSRVKSTHSFRCESNETTATRSEGASRSSMSDASRVMRMRPPIRERSRSFWKKKTTNRPAGAVGSTPAATASSDSGASAPSTQNTDSTLASRRARETRKFAGPRPRTG